MYRQDKATTERHARILRDLVKRPENKVCADCKRNDARWASWNIGVFICIRCSGIHRSMGTHISKVKSVDLDTWTPEQMDSIQQWGNHRANLYWEAHLRPGHIPPEHKMDSFIRSKYESRRWAREGPPPSDPSVLESGASAGDNRESVSASSSSLTQPIVEVPVTNASPLVSTHTTRQPRHHQLLSAATIGRSSAAQPMHAAATPQAETKAPTVQPSPQPPSNDLFTLDFHSPSPSLSSRSEQIPKKDVKSDILSLFSTSSSSAAIAANGSLPGAPIPQANTDPFALWGQQTQAQAAPVTSMVGQSGIGMWGVQSGWTPNASQTPSAQTDVWGAFTNGTTPNVATGAQKAGSTNALFETSNVWGGGATNTNTQANGSNNLFSAPIPSAIPTAQKKDDVFGDLWGDFK